jgi:hypothetical protein
VDIGYNDAMLIRSAAPVADRVHAVAARFERVIIAYEAGVESITDMPAAIRAMRALAHPPPAP